MQQWITQNILRNTKHHSNSFAYHPNSCPTFAAWAHQNTEWLLKIDIEDFFHNITESKVSAAFYRLGYPRLLSFELARLVTFVPSDEKKLLLDPAGRWTAIRQYQVDFEGVLPQGAPTSPMLSNLVMHGLDNQLTELAFQNGMRYSRYADDLAFSCTKTEGKNRSDIEYFKGLVLDKLSGNGFKHNRRKTAIRGPGTRRIILGILVDGREPRLPADFWDMLRLHIYYLKMPNGPSQHAKRRNTSVSALYHHVRGLIAWATSVEPSYGERVFAEFKAVQWPPIQPRSTDRWEE